MLSVEIIGVKFDYNDTQIKCIGRLTEDGKTEEVYEDDEVEDEEEEMDLGDESDTEEEEEQQSLSSNSVGGGTKNDIISMVGGTLNQDKEDVDLDENLELNLEEVEMGDSNVMR